MNRHIIQLAILFLAGSINILAFAPFDYFYLAIAAPALLLISFSHQKRKWAFFHGYSYGLGYFAAGVSWVYISLHNAGGMGFLASLLLTTVFIAILAIFIGATAYASTFFPRYRLITFPFFWTLGEYLRSTLFTGFPWLLIGESQLNSPLSGYLPILGIFGTTFLTVLLAAFLVYLIQRKDFYRYFSLFSLLFILLIGQCFKTINWTAPLKTSITASLIQGNIPQSLKWDPNAVNLSLYRYQTLTQASLKEHQWVIWPESALPIPLPLSSDFVNELAQAAKLKKASIFIGVPIAHPDQEQYYNALIVVGQNQGRYIKKHLVPFGEYIPLAKWFHHLLAFMDIDMTNFIPGSPNQPLLKIDGITVAPFICYEIAYPKLVRETSRHANLLITISDDAWFGHSLAASQHLQIAEVASLVTGRPQLFATDDGITAVINSKGQVIKIAPRFTPYILTAKLHPVTGLTPYLIL